MSRNHKHNSNSSGVCIYCNVFFARLAAHMLSSETCMLASQQLLMDKRNHFEHDNISQSKNPIDIEKCHVTRSFSQNNKTHSTCNQSLLNTAYVASLSHNIDEDSHICDEKTMKMMIHQIFMLIQ